MSWYNRGVGKPAEIWVPPVVTGVVEVTNGRGSVFYSKWLPRLEVKEPGID